MKVKTLSLALLLLGAGLTFYSKASDARGESGPVLVLNLDGTINPAGSDYLESGIAHAEKIKSPLIVVKLNTPGGLLSTTRSMAQAMAGSEVPVAIWVTPAGSSATSAGAIISMSSHFVFMAEGTNIGAAHPVGSQGEDIQGDMAKKAVNDTVAFVQSMAKLRGKNEALAKKIVSESVSFTASEAFKKGVVDGVANDLSAIFKSVNGRETVIRGGVKIKVRLPENPVVETLEMSLGQKFLHIVSNPNIAYILMMLGGLGIYVEITSPGVLIPGILGAISLILAFISLQTLPINTGSLLLIFLGIGMLIAEPFVPSFGALTLGGIASLVIGSLFLIDTSSANLSISIPILIGVLGAIISIAALVVYGVAKVMRRPKAKNFGLEGFEAEVKSVSESKIGGKLKVRGEIWGFQSNEPLQVGDRVIVKGKKGFKLEVVKKGESAS